MALGLAGSFYERKIFSAGLAVCLAVSLLLLPRWEQGYSGYFRIRQPQPYHFEKLFFIPKISNKAEVLFLEDGPNASVALVGYPGKPAGKSEGKSLFPSSEYESVSYFVNGKAIGNSLGDFSTTFLLASLGYLYAPGRIGLSSSVIGLGMGITAGILAQLEKIKEVTVLEIAPEVVENVRRSPAFSFELLNNPKAKIIEQDGFKYFTKTKKKFDLIVSEPSNPWVVGVENVFSYEFYKLAKSSLADDGVLVQWVQLYSIDTASLRMMFHTLKKVFPYAKVYRVGAHDIAIVASPRPLKPKFSLGRFVDPRLKPYYSALGFHKPEDLILTQIFSEDVFSSLAQSKDFGLHTLVTPKLAYKGDKTFFLGGQIDPAYLAPEYFPKSPETENKKIKSFQKYTLMKEEQIKKRCMMKISFFCNFLIKMRFNKTAFEDTKKSPLIRLNNYVYLRRLELIKYQSLFLEELKKEIIEKKESKSSYFFDLYESAVK